MHLIANLSFPSKDLSGKKERKSITFGRWASVDHFFVESLYLCTQHLFMEVELNYRGYLQPGRSMLMMTDAKQF